jgi:hypothetical protein
MLLYIMHATNLTLNETKAINLFSDHKDFRPHLIDKTGIFHEKIGEYPRFYEHFRKVKKENKEN